MSKKNYREMLNELLKDPEFKAEYEAFVPGKPDKCPSKNKSMCKQCDYAELCLTVETK